MSACSCWVGAVRPRACSLLRVRGIARPLPFANRRLRPPSPSPLGPPSILRLALPLSLTNLIGFCITLVTMSLVGRLGEYELSVAVGGWVGQGGVCGSCACRSLACLRPAPRPPAPPTPHTPPPPHTHPGAGHLHLQCHWAVGDDRLQRGNGDVLRTGVWGGRRAVVVGGAWGEERGLSSPPSLPTAPLSPTHTTVHARRRSARATMAPWGSCSSAPRC